MLLQHQFPFTTLCLCKSILHVSDDLVNSWILLDHLVLTAKCPLRLVPGKVTEWVFLVVLLCLTTGTVSSANCQAGAGYYGFNRIRLGTRPSTNATRTVPALPKILGSMEIARCEEWRTIVPLGVRRRMIKNCPDSSSMEQSK
jgi:hypothetical protein